MVLNELQHLPNIIFDLGGVILNLSIPATVQAFAKLSGRTVDEIAGHMNSPEFLAYEKGLISDDAFRQVVREKLRLDASNEAIDACWNAMLGALPPERISLLLKLRHSHRTFLLSNTNAIHLAQFEQITQGAGIPSFNSLFHKAYYSHRLHMRKPDAEVFLHVLQENNLKANETLFLDDSLANIQGAERVGIKTVHIQNPAMMMALFA